MAVDARVQELLDEFGDSGRTPEEVCAACPELLPEVRRRWLRMCAVKAELDALFPTPGSDAGPGADTAVPWRTGNAVSYAVMTKRYRDRGEVGTRGPLSHFS